MRKLFRSLLLLYTMFVLSASANAHMHNYGINEGMLDNTANCIAQDRRGFIWIGTSNGLLRFDGLFFSVFRHDNLNSTTLANNNVHRLLVLEDGVYVAHDNGLDWYSYVDGVFIRCRTSVGESVGERIAAIVRSGGDVIATTESGKVFRVRGTQLERIDSGRRLYAAVGTPQGVFALGDGRIYLYSHDMKRVKASAKTDVKYVYETMAFYSERMRRVVIGSGIGRKSYVYDLKGGMIRKTEDDVPSDLRAVTDNGGCTAFGTDGRGVMLRSDSGDRWLTQDGDGICGDAVYSLLSDMSGNLWIGSYRMGMTLVSMKKQLFGLLNESSGTLPFDLVTAVAANGGTVYVGMDGGGLGVYRVKQNNLSVKTTVNSALWGDNIVSMAEDGETLWLAVFGKGLSAYDVRSGAFTNYTLPLKTKDGDVIWTLCYDGNGKLWVGGRDVFIMDTRTRKIQIVPSLVGTRAHSFSICGNYMWMGGSYGLYKVNRKTLKVEAVYNQKSEKKLPSNNIQYVYADSRGKVWVSMCDAELCCIDESEGMIKKYGTVNGIDNYVVRSIAESKYGYMVFATGNGMYYYFPKSDIFMRFDTDNGLPVSYNYGAVASDGGQMFFGSTQGLLMCKDVPMKPQSLFSDVSFTSLQVTNGRRINLSGSNPEKITLKNDENYFSVSFSVPEYVAPHALRFSYYLKGMETEWRTMTAGHTADYTNVAPGDYEFLVRCTNLNGTWTTVSTLRIRVLPPWYLTWWAKLLWTLVVVAIVMVVVRIYLYQLKMRHKMELAQVEKESQRQLDDAKMMFFTNITHELRTPVFLIAAQLEELIDRRHSVVSVPSAYLYSMHRSTRKLNQLISRAIDFRKMNEGKLTLKRENVDMNTFLKGLAEDYDNLCDQKNISFTLHVPNHKVMLSIDREKIEMCINNLISNAFKYTKADGQIELSIVEKPGEVVISVKDNGIGIVPKAREEIFGNFYRTERGQAYGSGDGIGLSFVKTLVEMHGGRIWLESEVNKGSEFFISIPTDAPCVATEATDNAAISDPTDTAAISNDEDAQPLKLKASPKSNPSATHTLLIIDDDHETIELLERSFISDFTVLKAYDGDEGLKVATASLPDLIVCDMMMPNLDGIGFLQTLKNDRKLQHIKVIILTGQTSEEERITAYDAGADAYLTKPVSLKLLHARINRMIAESDTATLTNEISREKRSYTKEEQIFLLRCREIIDTYMSSPDFNVDFLAEKLAMSHSALYKKLKQMTGMSLIEFVNDYKIFKAVQMFKEGKTCVEHVAEQCGFGDVKNFRTLFKRKMQMTPKQYVQSL